MSLWKRAPRAVYRVYDEDDYLAGEGADGGHAEAFAPPVEDSSDVRLRRIGGIALLMTATVAVAVLIATHSAHLRRAVRPAQLERRSAPVRTPSARDGARRPTVRLAVASEAPSPSTRASPRRTRRAFRHTQSTLALVQQQVGNQPATHLAPGPSPVPSAEEQPSSPSPSRPAAGAGAEFGFER